MRVVAWLLVPIRAVSGFIVLAGVVSCSETPYCRRSEAPMALMRAAIRVGATVVNLLAEIRDALWPEADSATPQSAPILPDPVTGYLEGGS